MVNPEFERRTRMQMSFKDELGIVRHSFTMSLWDEKEASMLETTTVSRRFVGIAHRVKKTAKGEARPTLVFVSNGDEETNHELADEQAERDFVLGVFPTEWRKVGDEEDLSKTHTHHITWKKKANSSFWQTKFLWPTTGFAKATLWPWCLAEAATIWHSRFRAKPRKSERLSFALRPSS